MNIEITEKYKASLIPYPKETLEPLKLPTEIFEFLTETGLPIHAGYEITPNAPITFLSMPTIKKYPYLQHQYLQIGSLDVMGELAINLTFQSVYQIQIVNDNGYDMAILYLMNYTLVSLLIAWDYGCRFIRSFGMKLPEIWCSILSSVFLNTKKCTIQF